MANHADPVFPVIWTPRQAVGQARALAPLPAQPPAHLAGSIYALAQRYGGVKEIRLLVRAGGAREATVLQIEPAPLTLGVCRAAAVRAWDQAGLPSSGQVEIAVSPADPGLVFAFGPRLDGGWNLTVEATAAPDDDGALSRIAAHAAAFVAAPDDCGLDLVQYLTGAERDLIARVNRTARPLEGPECMHQWIEIMADAAPDRIALIQGHTRLTYGQLDGLATGLALRLSSLGVGTGCRVAIHAARSAELVIAMYAVLKTGAAFVPIDLQLPARRRAALYRLGHVDVIVTEHASALGDGATEVPVVDLGPVSSLPSAPRTAFPGGQVRGEDLAYIIFTSGSTGDPKGVLLNQAGRVSMILDLSARIGLGEGDRVLAVSSPSFDLTVFDVLAPLMTGAAVVLPERGRENDVAHWADVAQREAVTIWQTVPSALGLFLAAWGAGRPGRLRAFLMGGDWIPLGQPAAVWRAFPQARFISMGGATEMSVHSTFYEVTSVDPAWRSLPYGHPMANQTAQVLDAFGQPAAVDQVGDLFLGGMVIAHGYQDRPALTAERFLPDPFSDAPGARIYRTGDLARLRADGELELIGRVDQQVRIGGVRVEIGEIQSCLQGHSGVGDAVVVAVRDETGAAHGLAAYVIRAAVTPTDGTSGTDSSFLDQLRAYLLERLPAAMVPGCFVVLDELPVNQNGKVDRRRLERAAR